MDRRVDVAIAIAIFFFGAGLLISAQRIPHGTVDDPLGEAGLPSLVALLLMGGSAALAIRLVRTSDYRSAASDSLAESADHGPASSLRAGRTFGLLVAYVALITSAGFVIATPLFVGAGLYNMGVRSWPRLVLVAVVFDAVIVTVFAGLLGIRLPRGVLRLGL